MLNIRVPGLGPKTAKIAIIGEAPGADEDRTRKPFIGISGRELDRSLGAAQIVRGACYLTNVIKERPPSNDATKFINNKGKPGVWMSPEYREFEEYLYEERNAVEANVLVPVGNIALWALTRKWGITKYRGSILSGVPQLSGRKVIPTIHPAAALRVTNYKYFIAYDLNKVARESKFPEINLPERQIFVKPMFDEASIFLKSIREVCAVDIEVVNYELSCISFAISPSTVMSIPFAQSSGDPYFTAFQEEALMKEIARVIEDPSIRKIFQNAIFDCSFLFEKYGIIPKNFDDTMIAAGLIYPDFPKGLGFLTSIYTDEPYYKDEGKPGIRGEESDLIFWGYNGKDSAVTFEIMNAPSKRLNEKELTKTYDRTIRCIPPLIYMQARGIKLNTEDMQNAVLDADKRIAECYDELDRVIGRNVPRTFATSPKQKREYFYDELRIKPFVTDGKVTVNALALKRISKRVKTDGKPDKGAEEAKLTLEISLLRKLKGSYLEVSLDDDKRLRGSWNPIGTETGRFSVSKIWRG